MLRNTKVSPSIYIIAVVAMMIFIVIGIENYPNWKFFASLIAFLMSIVLLAVDFRLRKRKIKTD